MAYNGTTEVASGLKTMGAGGYPLMDAKDVRVTDAKRLDTALDEKLNIADAIPKPATAGTEGQLLQINSSGNPVWSDVGAPTDSQVGTAVNTWLTAHPEATTTVEDGSITRAKLDTDLKNKTDAAQNAIAYTEESSTASAAHAVGEHFIYNGVLYVATADIASGATITPNTNCKAVPGGIGGEVSDLKSALSRLTGNTILKSENKIDTGTDATVWDTHTGISTDLIKNAYVKVLDADNAESTRGYINVSIAYSDGSTATANYVKQLNKWQKINYNTEKTISAVYIGFLRANSAAGSAVTSSWEYIIVTGVPQEVIDVQYADDIYNLDEKSDMLLKKSFLNTEWIRGTYYSGVYSNATPYRICSENKIECRTKIHLQVASGFKFYVTFYDTDNNFLRGATSNWLTGEYEITNYSICNIVIARAEEDKSEIANINEFLDALSVVIAENDDELPKYVETELEIIQNKIGNLLSIGNVAVCGFDTDQHITSRERSEKSLLGLQALNRLSNIIPFNLIALGGDAVDYNSSTITDIIKDNYTVLSKVINSPCHVIAMCGNHDAYQNNDNVVLGELFTANMRNAVSRKQITPCEITCSGYFDDDSVNVRFVFVQTDKTDDWTFNSGEYFNWLKNTISDATGKVVLFSHHPLTNEHNDVLSGGITMQSCLSPYASKIICNISGHGHKDASIVDQYGILYIQTTCAWNQKGSAPNGSTYTGEDGSVRVNGTKNETAFDVFVINPATTDVYAIRYGVGTDRTWMTANRTPGTSGLTT